MLINKIDVLFDTILNNFFDFLHKKSIIKKFTDDTNFVVYQNNILLTINDFIKTIQSDQITKTIGNSNYNNYIFNIIKRYCAFYIYLSIAYYYTGGRDLFITNIIETSKNQKDSKYQIENFFNSNNNSKIINFFITIQNIISLMEFKTIDKIKIIMLNNPLKFNDVIKLFSSVGEDYVINYFLIKDNFHNIIKTLIFREIYLKEEKFEINQLLNETDKQEGEYKYIEVIMSKSNKIVDFNVIQKFLTIKQLKQGLAEDIYNYLVETLETKNIITRENEDFINYLFTNKIIVPITEEFLRYHKDTEKYGDTDKTKIKTIIERINNIKNYYSPIINKNPKLKLEITNSFYKNIDPRLGVLYNDNEEIKIIQKLMNSENTTDKDYLIDLENIRKYSYANFKVSSNDSIKLRTSKTIDAIRFINLKKKKSEVIETRIGHDNIDLNVVGVAFNPSRYKTSNSLKPLECFKIKNMINVNTITKKDNGFLSFIKMMNKITEKPSSNKLFYWIFNNQKDIPKLNKYIDYNPNDSNKNIKNMLSEIYTNWSYIVQNKFLTYIKKLKNINVGDLYDLIKIYQNKYFNFDFNPELKNQIINYTLINFFKEIEITEDITDNMIPGKRNTIIKLPLANIVVNKENIIILNNNKKFIKDIEENHSHYICNHYIKWGKLNKSSSPDHDVNQDIFEFVKRYVRQNEHGQYICKSCGEMLSLIKYVKDGTYNAELDEFMTTSLAVNQQLTELPKYANYKRTINNLGKNLEKIAYNINLTYYLGNDQTVKLRRKTIIKDTIDLILLHTEYIKKQPKNRSEIAAEKYNINKNLTNLFFFELKDEIFLTSSTDTDYYKLIKFNNVIIYLIFIIITELNAGQIISLKNNKQCNYFIFSKINESIFKDLYLRINEKEKMSLSSMPLLSYIIYYFSCILANNKLWLWNDNNELNMTINIQKVIIHTFVDLVNSIVEANLEKGKNYLYEILATRFFTKLKYTFNDKEIIKRINDDINKKIIIDNKTKKISFLTKKVDYIPIDNNINTILSNDKTYCEVKTKFFNKLKKNKNKNNINILSNCDDGRFHEWTIDNNNMYCKLCKKNYYELEKSKEKNSDDKYYNQLKYIILKKFTKKYCISGNLHEINSTTSICNLCNINPDTYNYTTKELDKLESNIYDKENHEINNFYNKIKKEEENHFIQEEKENNIINKFEKQFKTDIIKKYNSNYFENYIEDFIDRLVSILGNKIKIKNKTIFLKYSNYIIDHDYLGNSIKETISVSTNENIFNYKEDTIYYKDKNNKVYIYYDIVTLQYIGYSEDNKNIIKNKNNSALIINYSIKDQLLLLGLENKYTNLYHLDSQLLYNFQPNDKQIINSLIRNRTINLKQIITRVQSIIFSIRNHEKISGIYNQNEKEIVNNFILKLKNFNIKDKDHSNGIFKNSSFITNLINCIPIKGNINLEYTKNYINNNILNSLLNSDCKLIYLIVKNFNKLLDYNDLPAIQSELSYLIVTIIQFCFNINFKDTQYDLRKFEYLVIQDIPYVDERIKPVGLYQELQNSDEIDETKNKEVNEDAQEVIDALDIDDYDQDDDIDGTMEALDGDEN